MRKLIILLLGKIFTDNVKCQINVHRVSNISKLIMFKFHKIIRTSIVGFYNVNHHFFPKFTNNSFKHSTSLIKLTKENFSRHRIPKSEYLPKNVAIGLSILTWLGFTKDDEEKESELIMTLKRAILCTQREQFEKAEQMLHLALRIAQQQQNKQGILYCFDLMANVAFDNFELEKAEKLFVSVLQILLSEGMKDDNLKVS